MANGITIIGLGPGSPDALTIEAWRIIEASHEIHVRTERHPTVAALPEHVTVQTFDEFYEGCDTFDQVYDEITKQVIALGLREGGVVYAVPGHPLVGETSVQRILKRAAAEGLAVRIVDGVSFIEPTLTALGIDPFDGLQICDATILAQKYHPNLDPDVPALIAQLYDRNTAARAKMTLLNLYPEEHSVRLVQRAGTADACVREMPLFRIDRQTDLDHLTSLYIPALPALSSVASYQDVVARLRAPGGCPWDREQTHRSLRTHLLEESYEVLEALDADDMPELMEELGDLMLQVLLHAQIATEDGDFRLIDTVRYVIEKLVRRHPHVFAETKVGSSDDVLQNWEQIKRAERGDAFKSMLAGVSKALPALSQAMEIQKRVARVGFDWPNAAPVLEQIVQEAQELTDAPDDAARANEFGDLLFSLVNWARWHDIDAESTLREMSARFVRRFVHIERHAAQKGTTLEEMSLEEMDAIWNEAKHKEREHSAE